MSSIRFQLQLSVEGPWPEGDRESLISHMEDLFRERAERLDGINIVASDDKAPYEVQERESALYTTWPDADGTLPKALSLPVIPGFRLEPLSPDEQRAYDAALLPPHSKEENLRPYPAEGLDFGSRLEAGECD